MVAMRPHAVHSLIAIGLLLVGVQAHVGFYEPQLFDASGNDWSLEQPFQLPMDASQGYTPNINLARSINSVINVGETGYDALTFTLEEPQHIGNIIPWVDACPENEDFYPSVALLGPVSDPRFETPSPEEAETLPFTVPEGFGIIIKEQPRVAREPAYENYIPAGITEDCFDWEDGPQILATEACGAGESIILNIPGQDEPLPVGTYYIVWWDPDASSVMASGSEGQAHPRVVSITTGWVEDYTETEMNQPEVGEYAFEECHG